ncbi:hypothetical protein BJF84_26995 [Rhodococcus sp. CUA-806]|nr:hypothetical protein BJF84_26995 [Rhodococcus sp. CUA-806]
MAAAASARDSGSSVVGAYRASRSARDAAMTAPSAVRAVASSVVAGSGMVPSVKRSRSVKVVPAVRL